LPTAVVKSGALPSFDNRPAFDLNRIAWTEQA